MDKLRPSSSPRSLQTLWHHISQVITKMAELRVWQSHDRDGHACWHGYDPASGKSVSFGSESDMRAWIDQPHYPEF